MPQDGYVTNGAATIPYVRIYTDADGITRFEDLEYQAVPVEFAPPAPRVFVTDFLSASGAVFLHFPEGWTELEHPTPGSQKDDLSHGGHHRPRPRAHRADRSRVRHRPARRGRLGRGARDVLQVGPGAFAGDNGMFCGWS